MINLMLILIFLILSIFFLATVYFAKAVVGELDKQSLLLTALANKQGCTAEDIDIALGKSVTKKSSK